LIVTLAVGYKLVEIVINNKS